MEKKEIKIDLNLLFGVVLRSGKKNYISKVVYKLLRKIKKDNSLKNNYSNDSYFLMNDLLNLNDVVYGANTPCYEVFELINKISPKLNIYQLKKSGRSYEIPRLVYDNRSMSYGIKYIDKSLIRYSGKPIDYKLYRELIGIKTESSYSYKMKDEAHSKALYSRINLRFVKK